MSLSGDDIKVRGDRERLTEAFINIIDNAIKYNRNSGSVEIKTGSKEGRAIISVEDTGIGVPIASETIKSSIKME